MDSIYHANIHVGLVNPLSPDVFPGVKMVKNALTAGAPSRTPLTLGPSGRLRSPAPSWTKGEEMGWEEGGYEGKEEREWERRGGKEIGEGTGGEGKGKENEGEEKGRRERVWP